MVYSRRTEPGRVRLGARAHRPSKAWMQSSADPDLANRRRIQSKQTGMFNAQAFLDSAGVARRIVEYRRGDVIFTQGDPCESVLYIQKGGVKISVVSKTGRQAVVAMLGPGDFFGEGGLAGQPVRMLSDSDAEREGELELTPNEAAELDRRWMKHVQRPESAIPWDAVRRRLMERE